MIYDIRFMNNVLYQNSKNFEEEKPAKSQTPNEERRKARSRA